MLDISRGSAHHIVHDVVQFHSVSTNDSWTGGKLRGHLSENSAIIQKMTASWHPQWLEIKGECTTCSLNKEWHQSSSPKHQKIPQSGLCGKNDDDDDVIVGMSKPTCSATHVHKGTIIPYPTAFPYGNGMVLHFYQQQESSTTKTAHKVINKGLKAYV